MAEMKGAGASCNEAISTKYDSTVIEVSLGFAVIRKQPRTDGEMNAKHL